MPVTAIRTTLFLSPAQSGSVSGCPHWDLAVIHGYDEWSSVIKLGKEMAVLWNLLKAGVEANPPQITLSNSLLRIQSGLHTLLL